MVPSNKKATCNQNLRREGPFKDHMNSYVLKFCNVTFRYFFPSKESKKENTEGKTMPLIIIILYN